MATSDTVASTSGSGQTANGESIATDATSNTISSTRISNTAAVSDVTAASSSTVAAGSTAFTIWETDMELQARIEDLPRELYDLIQDFTLRRHIEAGPTEYNFVTSSGRDRYFADLKILQLSRSTRMRYAEAFYQRCNFIICAGMTHRTPAGGCLFPSPLHAVAKEHKSLIGGIVLEYRDQRDISSYPFITQFHAWGSGFLKDSVMRSYGARVAEKVRLIIIRQRSHGDTIE